MNASNEFWHPASGEENLDAFLFNYVYSWFRSALHLSFTCEPPEEEEEQQQWELEQAYWEHEQEQWGMGTLLLDGEDEVKPDSDRMEEVD